jgi:hypothetical protein
MAAEPFDTLRYLLPETPHLDEKNIASLTGKLMRLITERGIIQDILLTPEKFHMKRAEMPLVPYVEIKSTSANITSITNINFYVPQLTAIGKPTLFFERVYSLSGDITAENIKEAQTKILQYIDFYSWSKVTDIDNSFEIISSKNPEDKFSFTEVDVKNWCEQFNLYIVSRKRNLMENVLSIEYLFIQSKLGWYQTCPIEKANDIAFSQVMLTQLIQLGKQIGQRYGHISYLLEEGLSLDLKRSVFGNYPFSFGVSSSTAYTVTIFDRQVAGEIPPDLLEEASKTPSDIISDYLKKSAYHHLVILLDYGLLILGIYRFITNKAPENSKFPKATNAFSPRTGFSKEFITTLSSLLDVTSINNLSISSNEKVLLLTLIKDIFLAIAIFRSWFVAYCIKNSKNDMDASVKMLLPYELRLLSTGQEDSSPLTKDFLNISSENDFEKEKVVSIMISLFVVAIEDFFRKEVFVLSPKKISPIERNSSSDNNHLSRGNRCSPGESNSGKDRSNSSESLSSDYRGKFFPLLKDLREKKPLPDASEIGGEEKAHPIEGGNPGFSFPLKINSKSTTNPSSSSKTGSFSFPEPNPTITGTIATSSALDGGSTFSEISEEEAERLLNSSHHC